MPVLIVSDPATGKSQRVEIQDAQLRPLIGTRIGQTIDGSFATLQGYKLKFTGGTDKDGVPMRPDVHGSARANIVLSGGVGYKPTEKGMRKRKVVRGNTVSAQTTFLNFVIVDSPEKTPEPEPEEAPEETSEQEPQEESEAPTEEQDS